MPVAALPDADLGGTVAKPTIESTIDRIEALFDGNDQDAELPTAMDSMGDQNLHLTAHGRKLARKYIKELLKHGVQR